jgi:colicin import membrane protein
VATDWDLVARSGALERRVANLIRERPASEIAALEAAQHRADSVGAMVGDRVSSPTPGETVVDYRKRMLKHIAQHSPRFRAARFDGLEGPILGLIEDEVYHDAASSFQSRAAATPGQVFAVEERDRAGRVITKFHGDWSADGAFGPFLQQTVNLARINRNVG